MTPQVIELGRLRELTQKGSLASPNIYNLERYQLRSIKTYSSQIRYVFYF